MSISDLLPWRPKPLADELFSSWLCRVAYGNAPKLHTFCHALWPGQQIWTRDIDRLAPSTLVTELASLTGTPLLAVQSCLLNAFSGLLFEGDAARNGFHPWLLPIGIYHRVRRRAGLQWCVQCLRADQQPFYRRRWRLAASTSCPIHHEVLTDRCRCCGTPASPHRSPEPKCHVCGLDRRAMLGPNADPIVLRLECRFTAVLAGEEPRGDLERAHPLAYFAAVRCVLQTISQGPRSQRLRDHIAMLYGGDPAPPNREIAGGMFFEGLSAGERHRMLRLAAPLLHGWPWMMVGLCGEVGVWKSWALPERGAAAAPFVYADPIQRYLSP